MRSARIAADSPHTEQISTEPKKVDAPLAPGSSVSKMRVPTQARMIRKPIKLPINAPTTTAVRFFTALIQNARKSVIGRARIKPKKSPMNIPLDGLIISAGMYAERSIE